MQVNSVDISSLADKVQKLLDIEEVKNLHLKYAAFNESLSIDELMDLFTEDAVLVYPPEYGGEWKGLDTIRANFLHWMKEEKHPFNALYVITNPLISIEDGVTAKGRWTFTNYLTNPDETGQLNTLGGKSQPLFLLGAYEGEYSKVNDKWRIRSIKLTVFWPERSGS